MQPGILEKFFDRVSVNAETGCWEWTGSIFTSSGYAQFSPSRIPPHGTTTAHRFAYMEFVGPIPCGLVLDHLCRVRHCVNPGHLEPVTQRENIVRGDLPDVNRSRSNVNMCRKGRHAWVPENIHHNTTTGKPQCSPCLDAAFVRANERRRAKRAVA